MATAVQIELQVDEKGAVSGVRAFDTAVKGSAGSVNTLDTTLQRLNAHLDQMGQKGKKAAEDTAAGIKKNGIEALGSIEKMRLLEESTGVHVPRAMLKLAASSKIAQAAVSAVGMGIVGLGAITMGAMVFTQLIDGAKKLWDNYLSLNNAAEEYRRTLDKAKAEDYWKSESIETTALRIREATEAARNYRAVAEGTNHIGWGLVGQGILKGDLGMVGMGAGYLSGAHKAAGESVKNQESVDKLTPEKAAQQHELNVAMIEYAHAGDAALLPQQKINAELKKRRELAAEAHSYDTDRSLALGNSVSAKSGAAKEKLADDIAQREADAQTYNLRKEQAQELRHIHEEALESGLSGSALYAAQEAAAIKDLEEKHLASATAVNDIHTKFHNEEMKRLAEQQRETEKIVGQAHLAGLTGIAHVQMQGQIRENEVTSDKSLPSAEKDKRIAALREQTAAEVGAKQVEWSQRVDQVVEASQNRQVSGFARIRAEAEKARADLQRQFEEAHNLMDLSKPGAQQALDADTNNLGVGLNAIDLSSDKRSADLAQKNAQETEQIEAEAQRHSLSALKQQSAAIEAEYAERARKYKEELDQQEISEDDYNRRVAAAARERDAQMVEAAKAAREKMAGEFSHLFKSMDHPLQALAEIGDKVAGEAAAGLVQKAQQHFGKNGAPPPAEGNGGLFGNILGDFGFGGGKKHDKAPGTPAGAPAHPGSIMGGAASSMLSVGSATIHVATASISFGGGATGPGAVPGTSGGGTSLLGMPLLSRGDTGHRRTGASHGETSMGMPMLSSSASGSSSGGGLVGGAGDSTSPGGGNFTVGGGTPPPRGGGMIAAANNIGKGYSLFKQGAQIFGGGSSGASAGDSPTPETQGDSLPGTLNEDGSFTSAPSGNGASGDVSAASGTASMAQGTSTMGTVMNGVQGAVGVYSAYEGNGGVGGALSGAMSGMQLGMAVGGPVGAVIGAAAGAIVGAIGFGGREKARVYDLKTVRPRIANDMDAFQQGGMDYLTAYSDMESAQTDANHTISKLGPAANSYYQDTIKPEIHTAEQKLSREAKAGRSAYTFQAAQYDTGGAIDNFGNLATSPDHGLVHAQLGEFVVKPNAYQKNKSTFDALNAGVSMDALHAKYQASMQSKDAQRGNSGGDRTLNMHVYAHDSKSVAQFFEDNMHHIRRGLNSSYGSYGGLADA